MPSNFFAVTPAAQGCRNLTKVNGQAALAAGAPNWLPRWRRRSRNTPLISEYGTIYAFEVDGYGNRFLMDDASVPSLLAMPYLGDMDVNDPIWEYPPLRVEQANPTSSAVLAGEGIGGPHIGYDMAWPMSIMMKAFASQDDAEIKRCVSADDHRCRDGLRARVVQCERPDGFHPLVVLAEHAVRRVDPPQAGERGKVDLLNSITVK